MTPVRDLMTVRLAATPYKYVAQKEADAMKLLGYRPDVFWQKVDALIDQAGIEAALPAEVRRLRRLREARACVSGRRRVDRSTQKAI